MEILKKKPTFIAGSDVIYENKILCVKITPANRRSKPWWKPKKKKKLSEWELQRA